MIEITEECLIEEVFRWMENNNGKTPKREDMQLKLGYISHYQYEKFYGIKKWSLILEKMNIKPNNKLWEAEEIAFIKENYQKMNDEDMADILNRAVGGVSYKRVELNLLRQSKKQKWLSWEKEYLINNFYDTSQEEIESVLKHRKWETVRAYATKNLKLTRKNILYKYQRSNNKRICKKCNEVFEENEDNFYKDRGGYRSHCKKCWLELWYRKMYGDNYKKVHFMLYGKLYDLNNEKCDSMPEKLITNWLIENNINFIKQPYYHKYIEKDKTMRKFDWIINVGKKRYFVEYFGLWNTENYKNKYLNTYTKRAKKKIKTLYRSNMINNCLFIFPNDLKNKKLNKIFADILKEKHNNFKEPLIVDLTGNG